MRKFNLIKSLTRVINNRKGLLILCLSLAVFWVNDAWGHDTHTGKITVSVATGKGTVYVAESNTATSGSAEGSIDCGGDEKKDKNSKTFYIFAKPDNGYSFSKWDDNNATSPRSISITPKSGTKNYAATFTAHTYKVNFDGNGATGGSMNQQTLTYDQTSLATNAFTRSYTVNFDADGGSAADSKTAEYTFNNWNTKADGTGTTYTNQQQNLTTENGATINLYAQWKSASITLPSSTRSGYVLDGWFSGDTKIGNPGGSYTPTTNISLKAKWTGKYNPDFSYSGSTSYNVGDGPIDLQQLWTSTGDGAITYTKTSFTPESGQQSGSTEPAITDNRYLSLNKAGILKIHLEQAGTSNYYAGSADLTITISRTENTLAADATKSMKVDETWSSVISGKNSDGEIKMKESTDPTVAYYDVANNKIIAQNTNNQSFNSKEVTITISQEATYKYTAAEKTIKVTVNKHVPTFTWSNATLYHNQTYNDFFTTNCPNDLTVKSSSDDGVAYLVDGSNAQKLNLKTLTKAASTTLTVTQAENYYWAEHTETKTVTPKTVANHVPFTVTKEMYDALNDGTAGTQSWDNGIRVGDLGDGFDYDDKYREFGPFNGIPDKLSCSYTCSDAATGRDWRVYQSADGSNWGSAIVSTSKAGTANNIQLAPTTRYLKFVYSGNFAGYFQNITVTELRTFSTDKSSLDFGSNKKDIACASQTLTFNYANVGHKVTLSTNDPHFTVSPTSITNIGGEKYGSQTITVSYSTAEVHTASNAKLTITDELGNSKEITLSGSTAKKTQTINWEKPYDIEEPAIPIGKKITGAATASSNLGVIYESSDPLVIEIVDDGKAFKALTTGSATITAKQVGTEDWEEASISKTFKGTNKIIQVISWNQNFTRLLTNYDSQDLTAKVYLVNAETGEQTYSKDRSDLISYSSQNISVVSIENTTYGPRLSIIGKGSTTLTASVSGDDLYESATVTIPVIVRDPSAGCEDVLLPTDLTSEYEFWHFSYTSDMEKIVKIDRSSADFPGKMTFQHKGEKWGLNYSGNIDVYESTDNGATFPRYLGSVSPSVGNYQRSQEFALSRNATHLKFYRNEHATGYHYIKDIEIIPAQFIESNAADNTIDFGDVTVNSVEEKTVTLSYANVKDNLTITKSSSYLTLSCGDIIDLDCGATGKNAITITFSPKAVGDFNDDITFLDKISKQNYAITIKAKVVKSTQHITWEPTQTEYRTIDQIVLNATASSNNPVQYYVKEGTDVAEFVNGNLVIKKDGKVTIRAYSPADALWAAAADVDKTFTIRKTNLHFDPLPTAAAITYPQTLSESALTDGVVKDEDGKVVAGTIAWTNPATQLNAGENQSQGITFTPAANPAWYNALSSSVSVTIQKKESDAHAQASEIIYGAAVGTSILTNEGTTEGTWTWTDETKDQVLEVGTHEGLKVHFTPTNKTNYNEIDGTVSLTVKKATATLTWTNEPTSADVKEKLTYTATSNHSESAIIYAITEGADCATIDASTGALTITKAGTITVQASQDASTHYEAATAITVTTTLTGEFENVFNGEGDWNDPKNWTYGVPTSDNPDVVISGNMTIGQSISVGSLTIEAGGSVTIVVEGDLTVNGTSKDRDTYGNLFVRNGGDVTISENANVKVFDFVVESSIGTEGQSVSGQVKHSNRVLYTNGAYIDINMDSKGKMDDTQWYAFTVPFPVDVQSGIARKEGDVFRKCTYGVEYMICEYDINQRLNTGKGWKYIKSGQLQPGRFYYFTVNGDYNVYSFKAAENTITINNTTELRVNGEGPNANWNAVGNTTLTYATISGENVPAYVQTYVNGESRYITVATSEAQFVVGCPFFFQASETATMILNEANKTIDAHYAPRQESVDKPVCVRIAEEGKHFSDQIYLTASQEATSEYTLGRDLAKAGIGTKSAQLWMNAYGQKLSVQDATLMGDQAYYELSIYAPQAGSYELSLPKVPANAVIYLTQNGYPIWNLNETPYVIECYKGTTNEYGLLLRLQEGGSPTDMQTMRGSEKVQKIMKDQRIYINANTQLYDLMGQKVK